MLVEALDDFWWAGAGVGVRDRLEGEGVEVAVEGISLRCLDMLNKAAVLERQTKTRQQLNAVKSRGKVRCDKPCTKIRHLTVSYDI